MVLGYAFEAVIKAFIFAGVSCGHEVDVVAADLAGGFFVGDSAVDSGLDIGFAFAACRGAEPIAFGFGNPVAVEEIAVGVVELLCVEVARCAAINPNVIDGDSDEVASYFYALGFDICFGEEASEGSGEVFAVGGLGAGDDAARYKIGGIGYFISEGGHKHVEKLLGAGLAVGVGGGYEVGECFCAGEGVVFLLGFFVGLVEYIGDLVAIFVFLVEGMEGVGGGFPVVGLVAEGEGVRVFVGLDVVVVGGELEAVGEASFVDLALGALHLLEEVIYFGLGFGAAELCGEAVVGFDFHQNLFKREGGFFGV